MRNRRTASEQIRLESRGVQVQKLATLLPSHRSHLSSEKGDLRRQWQIFRANVLAAEERHPAEYAVVVADQFVEILIAPLIPGIDTETGDLIQSRCADKVFAHAHGAAARDAAANTRCSGQGRRSSPPAHGRFTHLGVLLLPRGGCRPVHLRLTQFNHSDTFPANTTSRIS